MRCWDPQQLLQRPLLEGLVGAVDDVGLEVVRGVVLDDVADVPDHGIVVVTPLEVLKKPKNAERERERGGGMWRSDSTCFSSHRLITSVQLRDGEPAARPGREMVPDPPTLVLSGRHMQKNRGSKHLKQRLRFIAQCTIKQWSSKEMYYRLFRSNSPDGQPK